MPIQGVHRKREGTTLPIRGSALKKEGSACPSRQCTTKKEGSAYPSRQCTAKEKLVHCRYEAVHRKKKAVHAHLGSAPQKRSQCTNDMSQCTPEKKTVYVHLGSALQIEKAVHRKKKAVQAHLRQCIAKTEGGASHLRQYSEKEKAPPRRQKGSATYSLRAVHKKSLSKPINMGSTFVDLDATNPSLKTDRDLEARFEKYIIFCLPIKREKRKNKPSCAPMPKERSTAPGLHVETRAREQGALLAGDHVSHDKTRAERAPGARVLFLTIRVWRVFK